MPSSRVCNVAKPYRFVSVGIAVARHSNVLCLYVANECLVTHRAKQLYDRRLWLAAWLENSDDLLNCSVRGVRAPSMKP